MVTRYEDRKQGRNNYGVWFRNRTATASLFASEGAKIVVADINSSGGNETVRLIREAMHREAQFVHCDVTKPEDCKRMVDFAVQTFGGLDILINNAGVFLENDAVVKLSQDLWDKMMNVNLKGVFLGCKYAIPQMIKQGGGTIVNTASVAGFSPARNLSCYSASKAGVIALTKAMAADYGPYKIRANCICPGEILTPMDDVLKDFAKGIDLESWKKEIMNRYPLKRFGLPDDVQCSF